MVEEVRLIECKDSFPAFPGMKFFIEIGLKNVPDWLKWLIDWLITAYIRFVQGFKILELKLEGNVVKATVTPTEMNIDVDVDSLREELKKHPGAPPSLIDELMK